MLAVKIQGSQLQDDHIQMIAAGLQTSSVIQSNFRFQRDVLPSQTILTMNLDNNTIGADGMGYLAAALTDNETTVISTLTLNYNCIGDVGVKYLVDAIENNTVGSVLNQHIRHRLSIDTHYT